MNLSNKFTLYFSLSKLIIIGFFILLLPTLFDWYSVYTIDKFLGIQRQKVFHNIENKGLDFYLEGAESYGSYTMLKEDYISIQKTDPHTSINKEIDNQIRIIDQDTAQYRILKNIFTVDDKNYYLLEIGRSENTITLYSSLLQRVSLVLLVFLILITSVLDFFYSRRLLRPFWEIIDKRLVKQQFPFNLNFSSIRTSTNDFIFLDDSLQKLMVDINKAFSLEREFTSNASHELLTPISILKNKVENMLVDEDLKSPQADKLLEMSKTLDRLSRIVRALLFLARIDSGQYTKRESINIHELLQEIQTELTPLMDEKNIKSTLNINYHSPLVNLNKELIFHLFYNIVSNAIRYNVPDGYIYLTDQIDGKKYSVIIRDTGIGISEDKLSTLFNRFSHAVDGQRYGLGLSIVKSIADFFDISVEVHSRPGEGTTFILTFKTV
ncbi:HAMP domain-containing sensor histidine kinase [Pseudopedobacter sp.]|uniref:sensor histidine kinase n=1 Tax=Pseudopedobacter sp. TaxID=1936787 RepID=UPI003342DF47